MTRAHLPWIAPLLSLAAAVVAGFFLPLASLIFVALALVTFFGALSGGMRAAEPKGITYALVAISALIVPLRIAAAALRSEPIYWRHELLMFGFTSLLVIAFLINRRVSSRARQG